MGQFADKTHRVGKQERKIVDDDFAHRGVERRKEFVFGKHVALGKQINQSRLAHIRIAHECHTDESATILALRGFLAVDFHKTLFEQRDAVENDAAVHFELRFTRSTQTHRTLSSTGAGATTLSLKVCPHALESRQEVAVLRQFNLCLGIGGLRTHGKDVKDEIGAVKHLHLQFLLDVAQLLCRKFIVKNHHADFTLRLLFIEDKFPDFLQFALSNISHRAGTVEPLRETLHGDSTCRLCEEFQFIEIFLRLSFILRLRNQRNQHGCFRLRRLDFLRKFFHSDAKVQQIHATLHGCH